MTGIVFSIQEFSIYDGPGLRISVFLKGCPLSCVWCHSPEGQSMTPQVVKSPNGCADCGNCEKYADKNGYTQRSINNCPMGLLRVSGEQVSSEELCKRLAESSKMLVNGGITFSGGEPLMQGEFLLECLESLQGRVHTAVQTSGYCDTELFKKVLEKADYFLYDIKLAEESEHIRYTGVSNKLILQNYKELCSSGKGFVTRIPLIPSITDTEKNITRICELLARNGVAYAEVLPYNKMAGSKYKMTGRVYSPPFDESIEPKACKEIFDKYGIEIKVL